MIKSSQDVYDKYQEGVGLHIRKLDNETILIEGNSTSLQFLGELIASIGVCKEDSTALSPHGAGSFFFTHCDAKKKVDRGLGLYIHNTENCFCQIERMRNENIGTVK